jgi:chromosome segregation ATPase
MSEPETCLPNPSAAKRDSGVSFTDPTLTPALRANMEAVRNDLEQAQELTAAYQRQLAGKSNECAELKQILEKTMRDLEKLQTDVSELRKERHRLANEVMRSYALQRRLDQAISEQDTSRAEADALRNVVSASDLASRALKEAFANERQILSEENHALRAALARNHSSAQRSSVAPPVPITETPHDVIQISFDEAFS